MNWKYLQFVAILTLVSVLSQCSEEPIFSGNSSTSLNAPVGFALIPGTPFGVIANSNVNLTQETGSLQAVDLDARVILFSTSVPIRNFSGALSIDTSRRRIFVPNRGDDALLVFEYRIPGENDLPISFHEISVSSPVDEASNGIDVDEGPYGSVFVSGTENGDLVFVSNASSGSVSVIDVEKERAFDLNPEDSKKNGIPLISAANFQQESKEPGRGANQIKLGPDGRLLFVTSTRTTQIYVLDSQDFGIEAVMDLSNIAPSGDTRGIVFDQEKRAYIAHRGINGVIVVDSSGIVENGVDFEIVDVPFLDFIPTKERPEDLVLSSDGERLFVSNQGSDVVSVFDLETKTLIRETPVGVSPGALILDSDRSVVYVLNFLSDSVSVLDETTGDFVDEME